MASPVTVLLRELLTPNERTTLAPFGGWWNPNIVCIPCEKASVDLAVVRAEYITTDGQRVEVEIPLPLVLAVLRNVATGKPMGFVNPASTTQQPLHQAAPPEPQTGGEASGA